jgi:hypothetical protein
MPHMWQGYILQSKKKGTYQDTLPIYEGGVIKANQVCFKPNE